MAKRQVSSQNMGAMRFETASLNAVKAAEDDFEQLNKLGGMMILVVLESTTSQHLLRSIMQKQKNINYILLGSQETTSTIYSASKRLQKDGYAIYSDHYELEDPFFEEWIRDNST